MNTIKIKKLEDLDGHKWYYNGNYYELRKANNTLDLILANHINIKSELTKVFLFPVSLNNLSTLRPLNLNVEVEEQPELKKSEKFFISKFREDFYIARDLEFYLHTTHYTLQRINLNQRGITLNSKGNKKMFHSSIKKYK